MKKFEQSHKIFAEKVTKWIPYEQFMEIEHIADGGFGKVYRANWVMGNATNYWEDPRPEKYGDKSVALKSLNNSQAVTVDFLNEITYHELINSMAVVKYLGVSQNPKTKEYVIVMDYIEGGNLRQFLNRNYDKLEFEDKLYQLYFIADGLNSIHEKDLTHRDFHMGNLLNSKHGHVKCYITDLGLCRPANEPSDGKVYGVLPYVAPEVLTSEPYTRAADIYSFGMIMYEVFSGLPPYHHLAHDSFLASKICQGLRPNLGGIEMPQLLESLIKRCLDADPKQRPTSRELKEILWNWWDEIKDKVNTEFYQQYQKIKEKKALKARSTKEKKKEAGIFHNLFRKLPLKKTLDDKSLYRIHPSAIYTSRLLDFKVLPKPQNSQEINDLFYSLESNLQTKNLELNEQWTKVKYIAKEVEINKRKQKYDNLKKALKLAFEKSEELEKVIATNQLVISEEMRIMLENKLSKVKELKAKLSELQTKDNKHKELERIRDKKELKQVNSKKTTSELTSYFLEKSKELTKELEEIIATNPNISEEGEEPLNKIKKLKDELKTRGNKFSEKNDIFEEQAKEINYLEARVKELTNLIKQRKEKIVGIFTRLLPDKEKEIKLIQNLVIIHLEFIKAKKQRSPSTIEFRKQRDKLRSELEELLGNSLVGEIEFALDDCEELVSWELELESRLKDESLRIENKTQLLQITGGKEEKETIELKNQLVQEKAKNQNLLNLYNDFWEQINSKREITQEAKIIQPTYGTPGSSKGGNH
ncbi:protein kinase [endosymbiont GvMRE of Glomus versiforme]|uniref:protein kinase n=1 Tax=endosymbiont GvMRE of Glomus versiforme TaxID=2039283 RepID=UPI0011C353A6|nr:protein kinase [endosymbiont GvMRE of Glomus versiforme]